jgi:hypothetical protein
MSSSDAANRFQHASRVSQATFPKVELNEGRMMRGSVGRTQVSREPAIAKIAL